MIKRTISVFACLDLIFQAGCSLDVLQNHVFYCSGTLYLAIFTQALQPIFSAHTILLSPA